MADNGSGLRQHRRGLLTTGLGCLLFTWDIPLLRLAGADQWTMIFSRGIFMFAAITLWWFLFRRLRGDRTPFIDGGAGVIVMVTSTVANLLFISAITKTTAANLVFILALNPIFCAILAWLFLKERVPLGTWTAVALALLGVGIIVSDGLTTGTFDGDVMALVVALCMAIVLTTVRKTGKNVVTSLATGSLLAALVASNWAQPVAMPLDGWGWVALNGLIVIPLASGLVGIGPRYLPSAEVAMFFLLDTVLTPVWVWMLFDELPTGQSLIGGGIVIATLAVHGVWRYRSNGQADPAHRKESSQEAEA
jgi:drug/metabolite transporter (DMT)-like permease